MSDREGTGGDPWPAHPVIGPPPPRQTAAPSPSPDGPPPPSAPPTSGAPGGPTPEAPAAPRRRGRGVVVVGVVLVAVVALVAVALVVRGGGGSSFTAVPLGRSEGPPSEPGDEVWSVPLDEEGLTTVLGGEDVVLVTEDAVRVLALDAADGDELWTAELEGGDFNRAIPLRGGGVLLESEAEADEPTTRLVDERTGEEIWEVEGAIPTIYRDHTSSDASSIHDLDIVILIGNDDSVIGVDRATGEQAWELEGMEDAGLCGGHVVASTDGISEGFSMVVASADSGDEIWSADGRVGPCRDGKLALTDEARVTVRDASAGARGRELALDEDPGQVVAQPIDGALLVQGVGDAGDAFAAIYPPDGDDPVHEADGVLGTTVGDGIVFLAPTGGAGAGTFVRAADGQELATTTVEGSGSDDCFDVVTATLLLRCGADGTELGAYSLVDGSERWVLDAGDDAIGGVGVVGERLVVAYADRVVAYD